MHPLNNVNSHTPIRVIKTMCWCILLVTLPSIVYGYVSEEIVEAIISAESANNPWAISKDGCRGLGQIKEETWYWMCRHMNVQWTFNDAFDEGKNRRVTVYYLNWLQEYLIKKGCYSEELLFAAYNAGPGAVRKYKWQVPPYNETRTYVKRVKEFLNEYRQGKNV